MRGGHLIGNWQLARSQATSGMDQDAGTRHSGGRVSRHYGVSRKTFYKWQGRYRQSGRDRSRCLHSHPRSVSNRVEERVVSMRRRTRYGFRRISRHLAEEGISISVYGVYRVLQRAGLIRRRRPRPRRKPRSYVMAVPGRESG